MGTSVASPDTFTSASTGSVPASCATADSGNAPVTNLAIKIFEQADPTLAARLKLDRQWLHARELAFVHPRTYEQVRFVSDYPDDLKYALDVLQDVG